MLQPIQPLPDPGHLAAKRFDLGPKIRRGGDGSGFGRRLRRRSGGRRDILDRLGLSLLHPPTERGWAGGRYWIDRVRLGRRHRIDFGYFGLSRRSDALLAEEVRFGSPFPAEGDVV